MFKIVITNHYIEDIIDYCKARPYFDGPARYVSYTTVEEGEKRIMLSYEDRVVVTEEKAS